MQGRQNGLGERNATSPGATGSNEKRQRYGHRSVANCYRSFRMKDHGNTKKCKELGGGGEPTITLQVCYNLFYSR